MRLAALLDIELTISIKDIKKSKEDSTYRSYVLYYKTKNDQYDSVDAKLKGRGNFRLRECFFPPLWLKISKHDAKGTPFVHNRKLKLVLPCENAKQNELIVKEYLCYKIYEIISGYYFKSRMVNVALTEMRGKNERTFNIKGIFIEDMSDLTRRTHSKERKSLKLLPGALQDTSAIQLYLFEYLIGNTDWSVPYTHNIRILSFDDKTVPSVVPYDFDHSGIVDAPYAQPAEELLMKSVLERRYRGYCVTDLKVFEKTIALYNRLKNDIYSLFTKCSLLDAKYIKSITRYLDEFYATINDPKSWQKDFAYPCDKNGTGNVVIKGLKED